MKRSPDGQSFDLQINFLNQFLKEMYEDYSVENLYLDKVGA